MSSYPASADGRNPALHKPRLGQPCNQCGYCCTAEPCQLAQEFLHSMTGPCTALEFSEGKAVCGLVRNPLGYLFKAAHPGATVNPLDPPPATPEAHRLSVEIAAVLGLGVGCDSEDEQEHTPGAGLPSESP